MGFNLICKYIDAMKEIVQIHKEKRKKEKQEKNKLKNIKR
jgi:hypothetical protein